MVIKRRRYTIYFEDQKNPSNLKREQMKEDTIDNLNIAHTLIIPTKIQISFTFPRHVSFT